jgi:hypothetical protein
MTGEMMMRVRADSGCDSGHGCLWAGRPGLILAPHSDGAPGPSLLGTGKGCWLSRYRIHSGSFQPRSRAVHLRLDLHCPPHPGLVMPVAGPPPVLRLSRQSTFHRVLVDVTQLFDELLVAGDVAIVVVCLPEWPLPAADRNRKLQRLNRSGQQAALRTSRCTCSGIATYPPTTNR